MMEESLTDENIDPDDPLMLMKVEDDTSHELQVDFSTDEKVDLTAMSGSDVGSVTLVGASALNIPEIELTDGEILLESAEGIDSALDSEPIQLDPVSESYVQNLTGIDDVENCDVSSKFIDGQAVQLEDGTMAYIHTMPREGLQPVQLEDGTMAYLSHTRDDLFNGEASGLDLEQLSSPQMSVDSSTDQEDSIETLDSEDLPQKSTPKTVKNRKKSASQEKSFLCPYEGCSRVYTTPHHLKVHERAHTGDRPFKCNVVKCGKSFATGYGLKSHTRVHTGETPYKCHDASCTKAFKTSGDLQKHLRTHTGERPFKCPIEGCDRAFTTSNIRKVHIRTHTGERPYICDNCGRAFASATNFKNHIRIHTGEKPYACPFEGCNKKFTEYSSLYKHNVVHTRDKPYACKLCGKHYRQTSTLATHERMSHKNVERSASKGTNTIADESSNRLVNVVKKQICFEFDPNNELASATSILLKNVQNIHNNFDLSATETKKLPTIIALQSDPAQAMSENAPVYAVQLREDGSFTSPQQILLVTDPSQLAALQQLTQVHVQNNVPAEVSTTAKAN